MRFRIALLMSVLVSACGEDALGRWWQDRTGRFSLEGELVTYRDSFVWIRAADGRTKRIAWSDLSAADQRHVGSRLATSADSGADSQGGSGAAAPASRHGVGGIAYQGGRGTHYFVAGFRGQGIGDYYLHGARHIVGLRHYHNDDSGRYSYYYEIENKQFQWAFARETDPSCGQYAVFYRQGGGSWRLFHLAHRPRGAAHLAPPDSLPAPDASPDADTTPDTTPGTTPDTAPDTATPDAPVTGEGSGAGEAPLGGAGNVPPTTEDAVPPSFPDWPPDDSLRLPPGSMPDTDPPGSTAPETDPFDNPGGAPPLTPPGGAPPAGDDDPRPADPFGGGRLETSVG